MGFFGEAPEGCASLREPSLRGFRGKRASGGGQKNEIPKAQRGPRYRGAAGGGGSAQSRSGPAKPRRIWGGESRGGRPPPQAGGAETRSLPLAPEGSRGRARLSPFPSPGGSLFFGESRPPRDTLGTEWGRVPPLLGTRYGFVKDWGGGCFWGPPLPVPSGDLGSPPAGCPCHQEVPRPAWSGRRRGQGRVLGELVGRRRAPGGRRGTATLPASRGRVGTGSWDRPSMAQYTRTGRHGSTGPSTHRSV